MKQILFWLDPTNKQEENVAKILENPTANKTFNLMGASILLILISFIIGLYLVINYSTPRQRPLLSVSLQSKEIKDLNSLPYPQQSMSSLQNWVSSAVRDLNSLSFANLEEQIDSNRKYFLDDSGHAAYAKALEDSGILKQIRADGVRNTVVVLKNPVQISFSGSGENIYWLFRVPVLINYSTGSAKPFSEVKMAEVLVVRVPAYKNHKGLAIARLRFA